MCRLRQFARWLAYASVATICVIVVSAVARALRNQAFEKQCRVRVDYQPGFLRPVIESFDKSGFDHTSQFIMKMGTPISFHALSGFSREDLEVCIQWTRGWEFIDLSDVGMDDATVSLLTQCPEIRTLTLARNPRLSDAGITTVSTLSRLHTLDISDTNITDTSIDRLASINTLRRLLLDRTRITTSSVRKLTNSSVKTLSLVDCPGIEPAPEVFAQFRRLYNISLDERVGTPQIVALISRYNASVDVTVVSLLPATALEPVNQKPPMLKVF